MSLFGSKDFANNAPKYAVAGGIGVSANGQVLFGNTQVSAYVSGASVGVFGVDTTEKNVAGDGKKTAHAGWNLRKQGSGPVININANTGSYGANSYLTFSGGGSNVSVANATVTVDATGRITGVTINTGGRYTLTPTATPTSGNGAFTITMGGRANRTQYETLVAMGSMTQDDEDTIFPDA